MLYVYTVVGARSMATSYRSPPCKLCNGVKNLPICNGVCILVVITFQQQCWTEVWDLASMLITKLGPFNGITWENLCQLVFKKKYDHLGYQQMVASPGDFGLEGFTLREGLAFQCYCPNSHYGASELYEKQRDKITDDLGKLKAYEAQIAARIGAAKIRDWHFVTPEVDRNKLLAHARTKEDEVRRWGLSIIDSAFTIHLRDADFYLTEINEIRSLNNGEAINFDTAAPILGTLDGPPEEYEANIRRKTEMRLAPKAGHQNIAKFRSTLYDATQAAFLEHGALLSRIEMVSPPVYFKLIRLVNEYEKTVLELGSTWIGTAEELVARVKDGLAERVVQELSPHLEQTDADKIARHIVARWLAVCELDFD